MHPRLWNIIPSLWFFWGTAVAVGFGLIVEAGRRRGWEPWRILAASASIGALFVIGTKAMYLAENPARLASSGWAQLGLHGFRFPGGVLLTALAAPWVIRSLRLPTLSFLDMVAVPACLSIAVARIGCFLNGCCYGAPAELPWAVRYPAGSRAFLSQSAAGQLSPDAPASLSAHPLALYFAVAGLLMFLLLGWWERRKAYDGQVAVLLLLLWGTSKALLEPLRGAPLGEAATMGGVLGAAVAAAALAVLLVLESRARSRRRGVVDVLP